VDPSNWESVAKIAGPAVTLLLSVLGLATGPERARRALKHDSEIVKNLPKDSEAQKALLSNIEAQIVAIRMEATRRRDWSSFALAVVGAPLMGWLTVTLAFSDQWWWKALALVTGSITIVFIYGAFESAQRADRDEKGRRRKESPGEPS
jgi:hypothetical protein